MIVNNEYGTYSVPNEITYTYTAQAIINGDVLIAVRDRINTNKAK
jgi:hypothetical protein